MVFSGYLLPWSVVVHINGKRFYYKQRNIHQPLRNISETNILAKRSIRPSTNMFLFLDLYARFILYCLGNVSICGLGNGFYIFTINVILLTIHQFFFFFPSSSISRFSFKFIYFLFYFCCIVKAYVLTHNINFLFVQIHFA